MIQRRIPVLLLALIVPLLHQETVATETNALNKYERGCFHGLDPLKSRIRVCNSDDILPDAVESGTCRIPDIDHMEFRIFSENWESVFFEAWILQIILSELLDVPTTIETGSPDAKLNFYDPDNSFQYGNSHDLHALSTAAELGDCRLANRDPDPEVYESCAHAVPEVSLLRPYIILLLEAMFPNSTFYSFFEILHRYGVSKVHGFNKWYEVWCSTRHRLWGY